MVFLLLVASNVSLKGITRQYIKQNFDHDLTSKYKIKLQKLFEKPGPKKYSHHSYL